VLHEHIFATFFVLDMFRSCLVKWPRGDLETLILVQKNFSVHRGRGGSRCRRIKLSSVFSVPTLLTRMAWRNLYLELMTHISSNVFSSLHHYHFTVWLKCNTL
jgi:hypothetical protein